MDYDDIQGNVLTPFGTKHQDFLMVRLPADTGAARDWLAEMARAVTSEAGVVGKVRGPWIALSLTWSGLVALDAPDRDTAFADDYAFCAGPEARAADLGDLGMSAPATWRFGAGENVVDAIVTVAGKDSGVVARRVEKLEDVARRHGARVPFRISGARLDDGNGHFGFREGGGQPIVSGAGADTKPGEFVLGEPSEDPQRDALPEWMRNGSFQVLRVLEQDVRRWRTIAPETRAAWIGRHPDGSPMADAPPDSHVRKVRPAERFGPERRRLLRRGIPYGPAFDGDEHAERGLVFNAFMASIGRQFEYVQCLWANRGDFPEPGTGPDHIIGARDAHAQRYPANGVPYARLVRTRATVYALAPGLTGLSRLAAGDLHGGVPTQTS